VSGNLPSCRAPSSKGRETGRRRATEEEEERKIREMVGPGGRKRGNGRMWSYQAGWSRHREEEGERETEKEGNSLGVRPGHIGFSGESWSMFPGSWLTRGIGYKATRPPDWFVLSVTPAHAALSRNYSIYLRLSHSAPLAPFVAALSLHLSSAGCASIRSSVSLPPSGSLSLSLSRSRNARDVDDPSFFHHVPTYVSCPTRSSQTRF